MSDFTNIEPEPNSWLKTIPDSFYEVIGRIIPGGTFIFGLTYTIDQTFLFDLIFKKKLPVLSSGLGDDKRRNTSF
jgi:hypothetical protein